MNHEDIVLLLEKCFEQAVTLIREQADHANLLQEPGIAEALTQTADSLDGIDVQFHVIMLDTYKDEAREAEEAA